MAQNRLANVLAIGRGLKADPVQAIKWHIVAKAGGVSDLPLDAFVQKQPPDVRAAGQKAAHRGSTRSGRRGLDAARRAGRPVT